MWTRYGARPEMAALGLQNTEFSVVQGGGLNFSSIVRWQKMGNKCEE